MGGCPPTPLGEVRLDDLAQPCPRRDLVDRAQEHVALAPPTRQLDQLLAVGFDQGVHLEALCGNCRSQQIQRRSVSRLPRASNFNAQKSAPMPPRLRALLG